MPDQIPSYRGRFAPSPTGPLHFGSLVAAVASYLDAKHHDGSWNVRIDDIDHQRCKPEYSTAILKALEAFGFEWDGPVVYQHSNLAKYQDTLHILTKQGLTYHCRCSRKILPAGPYPGTCRTKNISPTSSTAIRLKTDHTIISVPDRIQGDYQQDLASELGDFVIFRADQMFTYHLTTVCDDAEARITHVIRGADLLDSTPRQIYLQQLLNTVTPKYGHIPIVLNEQGEKLSKQTYAAAVDSRIAAQSLIDALLFLNQYIEPDLQENSVSEILDWSIQHWDRTKIGRENHIYQPTQCS